MLKDSVNRDALAWMLAAQGVVLLPLFFHLPFWVPVVWLVATLWRVQIFRGVWSFPGYFTKLGLGLGCVGGLLASYSGKFAVEPMVGLLACSFALKVIEVHNRKGVLLIAYIGFIALAAQFLFSQTLLAMLYGILSLVLLIGALRMLFGSPGLSPGRQLANSGMLLAQSLPVMLVLFLVIPRLGQLWGVPAVTSTGTTGFGDSMSPGEISNLIKSNELAFRVTFESSDGEPSTPPPPFQRYWRGLVLDDFDGRTWRRGGFGGAGAFLSSPGPPADWNLRVEDDDDIYRYSIMLEPHQHRWLFVMMAPLYVEADKLKLGFTENYLLASRQPVASRVQYEVVSAPRYLAGVRPLNRSEWRRNTTLPASHNPRAFALAKEWQSAGLNSRETINRGLRLFQQSFTYTLEPPVYGQHSVDEFLFEGQRGFCEHFSSSFVFLMRAAGVPARVVLGYQGGEFNKVENYLMVKQSDAHAWAEVWLEGEGWVRVDPTAAVAPSRIERGLRDAIDPAEMMDGGLTRLLRLGLVLELQQRWDALSYLWHRWVLEYDAKQQRGFLDRLLGGTDAWRIALFLLGSCALVLGVYLAWMTLGRQVRVPPEKRLYLRFLQKLKRLGLERAPGETPSDFALRASNACTDRKDQIESVTRLYNRICYEGQGQLLPDLRQAINQL